MFSYLKRHLSWVISGVLILSFLSSLMFGVLDFSTDPVIVNFKSLPGIKASELSSKAAQFGYSASDLSAQESVLRDIVNERIVNGFVDVYKLNCGEEVLEQFISLNPLFRGEKGSFNVTKFNNYLAQINMSEALFKKLAKQNLLTQCMLNSFCSIPTPVILLKAVQSYQLQSRKICLAELSFNHPISVKSPTEEELRNIYSIYQQEFALPELRSIDYCMIQNPSAHISQKEIEQYFKDNEAVFKGKKLNQISLDIRNILTEQKLNDVKMQVYQMIDNSARSQNSSILEDIARKFGGKMSNIVDVSYDQLLQNSDLGAMFREVFNTPKGSLCDPYFTQEKIIICFIKDVKPTSIPPFENLNKQLKVKFTQVQRKITNEKCMEDFVARIKNMKKVSKEHFTKIAQPLGISCSASFEVTNFDDSKKIPDFMLGAIFDANVQSVTPVFVNQEKGKLYTVFIESSYMKDTKLVPLDQVDEKLRCNLFNDLYEHLYIQEDPKLVSK